MLRRIFSAVENLFAGFLLATTWVAWMIILEERILLHPLREKFVPMLIIWAGAFAAIETWEEGVKRILRRRRDSTRFEQQVLRAAALHGGRITYLDAKLACPQLSIDEASRFLQDLAARGHCVPAEDEEDAYLFPALRQRHAVLQDQAPSSEGPSAP